MALLLLLHAKVDEPAIRRIAQALRAACNDAWIVSNDEIRKKESFFLAARRCLKTANLVVPCLSFEAAKRHGFGDRQAPRARQFTEREKRILPIRLEKFDLSRFFNELDPVDILPSEPAFQHGIKELVRSVTAHPVRRRTEASVGPRYASPPAEGAALSEAALDAAPMPADAAASSATGPVDVFISYAAEDDSFLRELEKGLALLQRNRIVRAWHRGLLGAGEERDPAVAAKIEAAQVILLLISRDFLASDDCYEREVGHALESRSARQVRVIPILLRACDWKRGAFGRLAPLPAGGKPVTSWSNHDEAWQDIVNGIRCTVEELGATPASAAITTDTEPTAAVGLMPRYPDEQTRLLSLQIEEALARRAKLQHLGLSAAQVNQEIVSLKRQIRDGGQLRAGDTLDDGRYLLLELIGRGGFAFVWKAHDREQNDTVAVKVLHANLAGDPLRRDRFFRGARIMAELDHPAVVRILRPHSEDNGWYYFVMEFVPGGDLRHTVLKNLPLDRVVPIILRVGEALALAHTKGIFHRDIKPANILLDNADEPKLTDFDLVAVGDTTGGTRTGALGTFLYAAPEMLQHPHEADARADVFGLGMTAIFCLYGKDLPQSVLRYPEDVLKRLPCSSAVREVLQKAIEWSEDRRFPDAGTFCAALGSAHQSAAMPLPESPIPLRGTESSRSTSSSPGGLSPKHTFAGFVVGPSNQLAHAAAIAAAGGGGRRYNPLFIHARTGLGKTHLIHAIAHRVFEGRPDARIIYVSAEKFTNDFITAIQHHRMDEFRARYRSNCDVLLVDDIQFLAGREQTQDEFFHTFNALHALDRQIVITSNEYPQKLERIDEWLVSRFSGGLVADIQMPELETRVAIIRKEAALEGMDVTDDVALYLAQTIRSSVREIEGALRYLAAGLSLSGRKLDLPTTRELMRRLEQKSG
ncbi:DnaA/Hda family protein [Sorangium sp. So ce119]|uniref:DnaA ATPase domain-containing protein n=1 Tax=Sorangium sp. So ce119 TaxID=3133279 RepID=UPI003F5E265D